MLASTRWIRQAASRTRAPALVPRFATLPALRTARPASTLAPLASEDFRSKSLLAASLAALALAPAAAILRAESEDTTSSSSSSSSASSSSSSRPRMSPVEVYERARQSMCRVDGLSAQRTSSGLSGVGVPAATGSGFVVDKAGLVMTNDHVVSGMLQRKMSIRVVFEDGRVYDAVPVATDPISDSALIRLMDVGEEDDFVPLPLALDSPPRVGEPICVLGYPLGGKLSITTGVLSSHFFGADDDNLAVARPNTAVSEMLQFDASIAPGSSGGPILNDRGEVLGLATMAKLSIQGAAVCLGYSIDTSWPILEDMRTNGRSAAPALGLRVRSMDHLAWADLDASLVRRSRADGTFLRLPRGVYGGLYVTRVEPDSPARRAGVQQGDLIIECNGKRVLNKGTLFGELGPVYRDGQTVKLKLLRAGHALLATDTDRRRLESITLTVPTVPRLFRVAGYSDEKNAMRDE